jgi:hypothetical protein
VLKGAPRGQLPADGQRPKCDAVLGPATIFLCLSSPISTK